MHSKSHAYKRWRRASYVASRYGFPPLNPKQSPSRWSKILTAGFDNLNDTMLKGETPAINSYATENPAEFFAVVSEVFFELPALLQHHYPDVYSQLAAFYLQDPLARQGNTD